MHLVLIAVPQGDQDQESWTKNHGPRIMDQESWTKNHGPRIMDQESWTKNHGPLGQAMCWCLFWVVCGILFGALNHIKLFRELEAPLYQNVKIAVVVNARIMN
jgi:hypothetical protein